MNEIPELPEVACQLFCGYGRTIHFRTTPQELPFKIEKGLDVWTLTLDYDGSPETPLFDCERVVLYRHNAQQPWLATDRRGANVSIGHEIPHTADNYILLGPGWEANAIDLYWGLIRKAIWMNRETNPLLAMTYESALEGSK